MKKSYAKFLLQKTKDDYNKISTKFSSTRRFLSSDIIALEGYLSENNELLDLGCGNGRFYQLAKEKRTKYLGADISENLLKSAKTNYPEANFLLLNDFIKLPFDDEQFDIVVSLAVFHHIPSTPFRLKYLSEINRVLKKNGILILTVWDLKKNSKAKKILFKSLLKKAIGLSPLDWNDIFYPFKDGENMVDRYLHVFSPQELSGFVQSAGFKVEKIESIQRGKRGDFWNIQIIAKK